MKGTILNKNTLNKKNESRQVYSEWKKNLKKMSISCEFELKAYKTYFKGPKWMAECNILQFLTKLLLNLCYTMKNELIDNRSNRAD